MVRYEKSNEHLKLAKSKIPLASQTFSKSFMQYPAGVSPQFLAKGSGGRVWDIDGNEYVDFVSGLLAVSLGYNFPQVNQAVKRQLELGVSFSLPTVLEYEVADLLTEIVPCAEMVRFTKTGSDATTAAIRLARAYTQKDKIAICGYHGWHDWYIGVTNKNLGIPKAVQNCAVTFEYNSIPALEQVIQKNSGQLAAIIMEPMNCAFPDSGYLAAVRELTLKHDILLIFDEICTGLRFALGGAQELFQVTPDLCVFGKGIGNGHPISAVMGAEDVMKLSTEVFFSGTFGGEALSLAACKSVLEFSISNNTVEDFFSKGKTIIDGVNSALKEFDMGHVFTISGHPSWSFINIQSTKRYDALMLKTYFLQEMFKRGVIILGTHNVNFSHTKEDIHCLLSAYYQVIEALKKAIDRESIQDDLECEPIKNLFKVR